MSYPPSRILFRALMRLAINLRREGAPLELRRPLGAEWGTYGHSSTSREQYQLDALQQILPGLPAPPGGPPYSGGDLARHISTTFHANSAAPEESRGPLVEAGFLALRVLLEQRQLSRCSSSATSHGVLVEATSCFSRLAYEDVHGLYLFSYRVRITNQRAAPIKVLGRHWEFLNSKGQLEQQVVLGENGVVGQQPAIPPGGTFDYTSGCWLRTPRGSVRGQLMVDALPAEQGAQPERILAEVAPFKLIMPGSPPE